MKASECHVKLRLFRSAVVIVFLILGMPFFAPAKDKVKAWKSLSRPEKCWTFFHPFKAKTAYRCAQRSRVVTDSLEKTGSLTDKNGGQLDAFRHAYWMALMIEAGLPEKAVRKLGEKHEKGNYLDFKKGKLEDSARPDSMACVMDLRNNDEGILLAKEFRTNPGNYTLIEWIMFNTWSGKLHILKKDASGLYLTCNGTAIATEQYTQWYIPKCLVPSNEIAVEH